jgi:serine/threonine protein kinase
MGKPYDGRDTDSWACGVVLFAMLTGELPFDPPVIAHQATGEDGEKEDRRKRMLRIAKGAYSWPKEGMGSRSSDAVRNVVKRLLVRDPGKRARVDEIWDEAWMQGQGSVGPVKAQSIDEEMEVDVGEEGCRKTVLDGWVLLGGRGEEVGL